MIVWGLLHFGRPSSPEYDHLSAWCWQIGGWWQLMANPCFSHAPVGCDRCVSHYQYAVCCENVTDL